MGRTRVLRLVGLLFLALLFAVPAGAFAPKEPRHALDTLVFVRPELRTPQVPVELDDLRPGQAGSQGLLAFRAEHGALWGARLDARRNVLTLLSGGAIPLLPGSANALRWDDFGAPCRNASCIPPATVESLTRGFLERHRALIGIDPAQLRIEPSSISAVEHMLFATWRQEVDGVPVEGAALRFVVNRGNLLQVSTSRIAPVRIRTAPDLDAAAATARLAAYLGGFPDPKDRILDAGSLRLIPIAPAGAHPDRFDGPAGSGVTHALAWRIAFERPGVTGTWEALVDAHSGAILRFVDTNRYGRVHGGVYPGDGHAGAVDRPFPFVQTNLPAPNDYADAGGRFPGDAATVSLRYGKYTWVNDSCGSTALTTSDGNADYAGYPDPVGTDCAVPGPNPGDLGNTMSARTQYYHLTAANIKARTYYPGNSWLNTNHMNVNVNQSPWCNATSGGGTLNFYQSASGCWNLGEIPGVSVHEWGHSWDDYDESGGSSPPVETRADWTASVLIHDSCVGRGFYYPSGNCSGYGDACLDCSGIRDADYWKHSNRTPWTAANHGTFWSCSGGSYFGPCGLEDHCESGIATQALWEMVKGPRTPPEPHGDFYTQCGLDVPSGWQLMDRLYWTSHAALDDMYTCTLPSSSGCTGNTLYNLLLAIDDDGDGVGNGTPHAAGIFAALARHNIACGAATDPQNKNQVSPACLPLTRPGNLAALGQNNQIVLSWDPVPNATRYEVLRNETDCAAGFTRVATVDAPLTSFTDDGVVNGIAYYYRIQPYFESPPACTGSWGPISDCITATPVPCQMPGAPGGLTATPAGDNRVALSWVDGSPGSTGFAVYRALGACPAAGFVRIASGLAGTSFVDEPVSGQVPYSYAVTGFDETGLCETVYSNCDDALTTGACTQPPVFGGLAGVSDTGSATCALTLNWSAGAAYCGGPLQYRVHRSTTPGFTPSPETLIATVGSTTFTDLNALTTGTRYYYVVRAVDAGNGVEEANRVERSARPTGPPVVGTWTDDGGDSGDAKLVPAANCGGSIAWSVSQLENATPGGSRAYRSVLAADADNPSGAVPDDNCSALLSPPLQSASGVAISFWTRYDLEPNWDGVVLEARVCGDPACTTGTWQPITNAELDPDYPATLSLSEVGDCNGAKVCGDVYPYPSGDGTEWINDCNYPSTMQAFTGANATWTRYTATLPPAFDNATLQFRFNLSTDCASRNSGAYIDDLAVTNVLVPGSCAMGSACPANPFVDVAPDGPLTLCSGASQPLTASLTGGTGPFAYQWTENGVPIPGATSSGFDAIGAGTRTYNCRVQASGCPDTTFDPVGVAIIWQDFPSFAGLASVTNAGSSTCALNLSWPAAVSPCPGGVTYSVYRSTTTPVAVVPSNRVAAGLTGLAYADSEGLVAGTTYHYVVRAVAAGTGVEDGNAVERSGVPAGVSQVAFSDSFEGANPGWIFTKGSPAATAGDFTIGDPVGTIGNNSQPAQPEDDHTPAPGVRCLYTAPNPGGSVGADDVDNGEVVATSPAIDLSSYTTATLSLWRWFENEDVEDSGDYYVLEASGNGTTWVTLESIPDSVTTTNTWTRVQFELQSFVPLTSAVRIRFRVADGPAAGDIVEFAADDVEITGNRSCTAGAPGPPPVGDGTGGTLPMTLMRTSGNRIQVTVDSSACRDDHVVILAGALGDFGSYQWAPDGCAFPSGAGSGQITETRDNAWYIALWVSGSGTAGHPGSSSSGERTWRAAGLCAVTSDDPGDLVCP
jgi:hypothetical protein